MARLLLHSFLAIAQVTLPYQPIIIAKSALFCGLTFIVALPFQNDLDYRKAVKQLRSAFNVATLSTNLVKFAMATLKKSLLIF